MDWPSHSERLKASFGSIAVTILLDKAFHIFQVIATGRNPSVTVVTANLAHESMQWLHILVRYSLGHPAPPEA